jgi:hypothetical protein
MEGREGMIVEEHGIPLTVPLPPSGLVAESLPDAINLTWLANREMDLDGYNVYRSEDSTGSFTRMNADLLETSVWADTSRTPVVYYYCVSAVDVSGFESGMSDTVSASPVTAVGDEQTDLPRVTVLLQNYPNPFNAKTVIRFEISDSRFVSLKVFDLLGREVAALVDGFKGPGIHAVSWDASASTSGVYFYRLSTGGVVQTKRLILLK